MQMTFVISPMNRRVKILKRKRLRLDHMNISEIFYSLQGEGRFSGYPTIFVRTVGCNLRCSYCDTTYAYEGKKHMTISEILKVISSYPTQHVCITGGEPLLQEELDSLLDCLITKKYTITVETNGSKSIEALSSQENIMISLDVKCPSSGMHEYMNLENLEFLSHQDQLKCIIKNTDDYLYAKQVLATHTIVCPVFFQPVWGTNPQQLAQWILDDGLKVRLSLQLHKLLWGERQGV
jgi:7-carboxy-7-deazaguanine synthase